VRRAPTPSPQLVAIALAALALFADQPASAGLTSHVPGLEAAWEAAAEDGRTCAALADAVADPARDQLVLFTDAGERVDLRRAEVAAGEVLCRAGAWYVPAVPRAGGDPCGERACALLLASPPGGAEPLPTALDRAVERATARYPMEQMPRPSARGGPHRRLVGALARGGAHRAHRRHRHERAARWTSGQGGQRRERDVVARSGCDRRARGGASAVEREPVAAGQ
jgi:hypothetical protein